MLTGGEHVYAASFHLDGTAAVEHTLSSRWAL